MHGLQEKKFLHSLVTATQADRTAIERLLSRFGSYQQAWHAESAAMGLTGLNQEQIIEIIDRRQTIDPQEAFNALDGEGIRIVAPDDTEFPEELKTIAQPPRWLYIKGSLDDSRPHLAVVGTRKASTYGREATQKIIRELAALADMAIVSGLAQGIDAEAHRAAMDNNLVTIGVLGGGMDRNSFFPYQSWNLAEEMAKKNGAVISEYPPGTPSLKHHFIERNRLISGMSLGTLVIEAPEKSGALITANFALEQGREVFALPGSIFSLNSAGAHRLIQEGAKLVASAEDIVDELKLARRTPLAEKIPDALTDEIEKRILILLFESKSVDDLRSATGLETPAILSSLSSLELKGFVRPMGHNLFQRIT